MTQTLSEHAQYPASKSRLSRALPPFLATLPILVFWTIICAIACAIMLVYYRGWDWSPQTVHVIGLYAAGAALAVYPAAFCARFINKRQSVWRFVAVAILLLLATLFFTACIFALQYRLYFAQWHGEPFSRLWLWQQLFTSAGAVYTYLVLGLRLYVPIAVVGLFVTSWWVNRLRD